MRLMVVEDDDSVRTILRLALEGEGYEVSEAPSAEIALASLPATDPEVMIIDLTLGGMSGFDCVREIRRTRDIPIVIVSARDDTHDVVAGLEAGADDYVTKPFHVKEITARLRALLRRSNRWNRTTAAAPDGDKHDPWFGKGCEDAVVLDSREPRLVLNVGGGRLLRGGMAVHLTLTEFRLLRELAEDAGHVLSRVQLLDRVWDHGFLGDERLVDVHIRRLRTKIEEDPADPHLLVTVRGLGYRLDPP
jgi:DNA-binding response OmpR family regulator